jgi:hypothetical protein
MEKRMALVHLSPGVQLRGRGKNGPTQNFFSASFQLTEMNAIHRGSQWRVIEFVHRFAASFYAPASFLPALAWMAASVIAARMGAETYFHVIQSLFTNRLPSTERSSYIAG